MTNEKVLYSDIAFQYADDILTGKIPACKYVKQACQRFGKMLERWETIGDIYLDVAEVERWLKKITQFPHIKGKLAGTLFDPKPFQVFIVANIIGWKRTDTGKRLFREAYIAVPRKNGKSFMMAPLAIGFLCWDQYTDPSGKVITEKGAEVFCGATSKDQARKVFEPAKDIIESTPDLQSKYRLETFKSSIVSISSKGKLQPLKAKPADGDFPSAVINDEYHEHTSNDLVETMRRGMLAREQGIIIHITTAGDDLGGPCFEKHQEIIDILAGTIEDDSIFGIIYTIDDPEQWDTIEAFKTANPNWELMDLVAVEQDINQAKRSARMQNSYKTKNLNIWVGSKEAYFNILSVQKCRHKSLELKNFVGNDAFIGLDLNTKEDIASVGIIIPPQNSNKWTAFCKHYLPEETIKNNRAYQGWYKKGWLTKTPGERTDYSYIEQDIMDLCKMLNVQEIPYDPYNATNTSIRLMDEGLPMVEYAQNMKNLSEPTKEFETVIAQNKIQFTMDPVLFWMFGNVVVWRDQMNNVKPVKENKNSKKKIDGVVALIIAFARAWIVKERYGSIYNRESL